jgi:hypothetical protein
MNVKITQEDGEIIAMSNVQSVETDPPQAPPPTTPPPTIKLLKITDAPYNVTENMEQVAAGRAINQCYKDAKAQGAQVEIPPGKYQVGETLKHDSITVFNNGELFRANGECGYYMIGKDTNLIGGILSHEGQTDRGSQMWHHGIGMYDCDGFEIIDVHVKNPRAAGMCIWDGRDGRIAGCTIEDCLADGIHHVGSSDGTSGNIYERDNIVKRCGDDMISFVVYGTGAQPVHDIEVHNFRGEDNTWGRGITVLGAKNLVFHGANLKRVWCFGLYVGIESGYGGAGGFSQVVMNDVKVDVCGSWTQSSDTQDGLLMCGWVNTVSATLNDCIISAPKRHGVMRYHSTSNVLVMNNTIFNSVPGQEIYNVPPPASDPQQQYSYPRRFETFRNIAGRDPLLDR